MPSTDVRFPGPFPLTRLRPWYPGQFGINGTDNETGLRTHPTGAIFYVSPNHPGVSDLRDGTDPEAPLATVAAALTKCQAYRGDTIFVMANNSWQYGDSTDGYATAVSEEIEITVPGVSIVGVSPSGQGVYWNPASDGGTCITVSAIDCLIEGFFFTEGATYTGLDAIYCEWDGATLFGENLTVRNCVFDDTVDTAIQLEYSWYCEIANNRFLECAEYAVYLDPAGSAAAYLSLHDNWFLDCDVAMALRGLEDSLIANNWIYNGNAEGAAVATDEGIDTTGGVDNTIAGNYFSCLLPAGANGDWDDLNTGAATDAWIANQCLNGPNVTTPT